MQRNLHEVPDIITLARDMEVPEVKVVYLTVFQEELLHESLLDKQDKIREVFDLARKRADQFNIKLKLPEIQGDGLKRDLPHKPCPFPWRDLYIGSDGFIRPCQSSSLQLSHVLNYGDFKELWNSNQMQQMRRTVNDANLMPSQCSSCYHSSSANWNLPHTFIHMDEEFAPCWDNSEGHFEATSS